MWQSNKLSTKTESSQEYYCNLWRKSHKFCVNLPQKKWCDLWHEHFDWKGIGNRSKLDRRKHLNALFHAFNRAQRELIVQEKPYQIFLNISFRDSASDAIYVHTQNSHSTQFPLSFDDCSLLSYLPPLLIGHVDRNRYCVMRQTEGKDVWFIIVPRQHYYDKRGINSPAILSKKSPDGKIKHNINESEPLGIAA